MVGAIAAVAERSFFADVEPWDPRRFDELVPHSRPWLVATVEFHEGEFTGALSCGLPETLARNLLDAFTGRDPHDPEPDTEALFDLVGELSNMICGTWLTQMATAHQAFTLARPVVKCADGPQAAEPSRARNGVTMAVNDLPLVVAIGCAAERDTVSAES